MKRSTENGVPQWFSRIPKQPKQRNKTNSPKVNKVKDNRVKAAKLSNHHSNSNMTRRLIKAPWMMVDLQSKPKRT